MYKKKRTYLDFSLTVFVHFVHIPVPGDRLLIWPIAAADNTGSLVMVKVFCETEKSFVEYRSIIEKNNYCKILLPLYLIFYSFIGC
jgi:hypothetical protein